MLCLIIYQNLPVLFFSVLFLDQPHRYDDYLSNQHFTRLIHSLRDLYQDNFRRRPTRNKIQYFWLVRPNIEKMVTVEQMYKDFAVLADAKDKAGEVKMPMPFYTF